MPPPGQQLYFIAIVPPSPVREEGQALKEYFRDHFHSKAALNSPPHITLHMPFQWKEAKEEKLINGLSEFVVNRNLFEVTLRNFSCFAPRVIYIDVQPSESLTALHNDLHRYCKVNLNLFNARYRDLPFHPHLTLAFRDLRKDRFIQAWAEFKEKQYHAAFNLDKITLLKHTGNHWAVFRDFHF